MAPQVWSTDKAWHWYRSCGWLIGCNFIPSNAVNQIEMWSEKTFDPVTIQRELSWAHNAGFNTVRVFLHNAVWTRDKEGFAARIDTFLAIAAKLKLSVIPVLFDDCWHQDPSPGIQQPPVPGIHNSRWVMSPGMKILNDENSWPLLEEYVKDIISRFSKDPRIIMWDLYNEAGNYFLPALSLPQPKRALALASIYIKRRILPDKSFALLKKTFEWARQCEAQQPLSSPLWFHERQINDFLIENSDVITFHNYGNQTQLQSQITQLKQYERPLVCTEYMARSKNSLFETHLPIFRTQAVGCYSWGLVAGKTQTYYSWTSAKGESQPELWFHDLFHTDGSPYRESEIKAIREASGKT